MPCLSSRGVLVCLAFTVVAAAASPALSGKPTKKAAPVAPTPKKYEGVDHEEVRQALLAFDDLDYVGAVEQLQKAAQSSSLTATEKVIVLRTLALAHIALGENAQARSDFENLLRESPSFELDASFGQNVRQVFDEAKASLAVVGKQGFSQLPVLNSKRSTDNPREGESLTVKVLAPTGTQRVDVNHRTRGHNEYSTVSVKPGEGGATELFIPALSVQPPALEYYVKAFGANDQVIAADGSVSAPLSVGVRPLVAKKKVKGWVVGAAVGAVVVVGAVAAGVAVAMTRPSDNAHITLDLH